MARRSRQLVHAAETCGGLEEVEVYLRKAIAAFANPTSVAAAVAPRVRTQLFLAYGALAVRSWPEKELVPRISAAFNDTDLLQGLRVVAELVGEDGLSLGRRRQDEIRAALTETGPDVLRLLVNASQQAARSALNDESPRASDAANALLSCLSAWLALGAIRVELLANSAITGFLFDFMDHLAPFASPDSPQRSALLTNILGNIDLVATCATLRADQIVKVSASVRECAVYRRKLREGLPLDPLLRTLRHVAVTDSFDTKLAANVCATLVSVALARLSIICEHAVDSFPEHAFDAHVEAVVGCVTACVKPDLPGDVISATFEFWRACHEICESIHKTNVAIPQHFADSLRQSWEQATATYCTDVLVIPADEIYVVKWDANDRGEFRGLRREFRNLLRTLFSDAESPPRLASWIRHRIYDMDSTSPSYSSSSSSSWRLQESGLHALSALAQQLSSQNGDIQVILERTARLASGKAGPQHRALLRTAAVLAWAMSAAAQDAPAQFIGNNTSAHNAFVQANLPIFQLTRNVVQNAAQAHGLSHEEFDVLEAAFSFMSTFCAGTLPAHASDLQVAVHDAQGVAIAKITDSSGASTLALRFLVSFVRQAEVLSLDHVLLTTLLDCCLALLQRASTPSSDLLSWMDACPDIARLVLQLARALLRCTALPRRSREHTPASSVLESRLLTLHQTTCDTVIVMLNDQSGEIEDQDLALEIVQTARVLVLGCCADHEDVFQQPIPTMPSWFKAVRDRSLEARGAGLTRGLLCAGGGRMPAWAIDRLSLCLRAILGQFRDHACDWLRSALSEPSIPRAGASNSAKRTFLEKLDEVANAAIFKRHLKQLCGGKRKGAQTQRPKVGQVRKSFVEAT
ncbi:Transportin MOS14 [Hondaea fermentalgiana]|uniref:Transportin MOS14 n=1 Tax=Hondaea fermentalgiana TaxID=2315210 RepID=A0A2R5GWS6_9STRA|nr:Transportin MOS14 [Hondaea fermentalgiana]|eukprot:GBG33123.1 Transportin MOS14 [Hondaea fermentalgiana]